MGAGGVARRAGDPEVTVVVPVHGQESWLPAALDSLVRQTCSAWRCVVVDDGSPGDVVAAMHDLVDDPRFRLVRHEHNRGLGAALNRGLDLATTPYVAYLPADDVMHARHLESLLAALAEHPAAALAVAGVQHEHGTALGRIDGEPLQLVQVAHRRTDDRWIERAELTTDDLDAMLWDRLLAGGEPVRTGQVTCSWVAHPGQRHRALREPWGGLNPYRAKYGVREPLRLRSSVGHLHDEVAHYRSLRERSSGVVRAPDGLKILLVGELAHNPERIVALAERGHELHGLWTDRPVWFNTVGPLPFGHVAEVPRDGWRTAVRDLQPDVVYALLNWQAVPFAHEVLTADLDVPFVWHFKEGPFFSREQGHWDQLVDLHVRSDGVVYSSQELLDWFAVTVPATTRGRSMVLDGDLPRAEALVGEQSDLLSARDGDVHTVIAGRPMGPPPAVVGALAEAGVHVHVYSEKAQHQMRRWVDDVRSVAPRHLHLHPQVDQADWVAEFSQYDAGWLHDVTSTNGGDLHAATWDDLNVPARMATLAAAGVPMIQRDNGGSRVATQELAREHELGVFWRDSDDLVAALHDRELMERLRKNVWSQRDRFTFDAWADELVEFLRRCIAGR